MAELSVKKNDELVMKLLHYFITEHGYNPIVLHGAKDEIWLENLEQPYKIVRIVTNYIHNEEQFNFDLFRTDQIIKRIKKKMLTINAEALSIFVNLGENVDLEDNKYDNIKVANVTKASDLKKYSFIIEEFPSITKLSQYKEKGVNLFMKLTSEINKKNEEDARQAEDIFKIKKPTITNILIASNALVFLSMYLFGKGSLDSKTLLDFGALYKPFVTEFSEFYRLITSGFIHIGLFHFGFNMYALYILGPQLESFYGKYKFLFIYLTSIIIGNLMSMIFISDAISAGASGGIFGLLGAMLYFGYHYRIYLGSVIKSQIIPLIVINLMIGFTLPGLNNAAHIGGLIGGVLASIAVGVKYKTTTTDKINGVILTLIFTAFLIYMNIMY
jgi:rhomboid protease GluP